MQHKDESSGICETFQFIPHFIANFSRSMETLLEEDADGQNKKDDILSAQDFSDKISYAFQLATAQGPLCQEPMQGVAIFIEEVNLLLPKDEATNARDKLPRLTSEIIKAVRDSIHKGFLDWSPRLMMAMYSCEIQASSECHPTSINL